MKSTPIRELVKESLFTYPSLYAGGPGMILAHYFASGGTGYGWDKNGALRNFCDEKTSSKMDYSDLDERASRLPEDKDYADLYVGREMEIEAERVQRQFYEKNIDKILSAPLTTMYFGVQDHSRLTKDVYPDTALGLQFPDNINEDCGMVLLKFYDHWLYRLNCEFGVGSYSKYKDHPANEPFPWWPDNAAKAYRLINQAKVRLWELMYKRSYAEHCKEMNDLITEVLNEVKAEE